MSDPRNEASPSDAITDATIEQELLDSYTDIRTAFFAKLMEFADDIELTPDKDGFSKSLDLEYREGPGDAVPIELYIADDDATSNLLGIAYIEPGPGQIDTLFITTEVVLIQSVTKQELEGLRVEGLGLEPDEVLEDDDERIDEAMRLLKEVIMQRMKLLPAKHCKTMQEFISGAQLIEA